MGNDVPQANPIGTVDLSKAKWINLPASALQIGFVSDRLKIFHLNEKYGMSPANTAGQNDTAFAQALADAQAAGAGHLVLEQAGDYQTNGGFVVTSSYIRITGVGRNARPRFIMATPGVSFISFQGGGTVTTMLHGIAWDGIDIYQTAPSSAGIGMTLYYCAVPMIFNCQVSGFNTSFFQQRSTNLIAFNTICGINPTGTIAAARGWDVNCNSAVGDTVNQGCASSTWINCGVDMSSGDGNYAHVPIDGKAWYIHGTYCGDLALLNCSSSFANTGIYLDFSTVVSQSHGNGDVYVQNFTCDQYATVAFDFNKISAATIDNWSSVTFEGCWSLPYPSAPSPVAYNLTATKGLRVIGAQLPFASNQIGVAANDSSNCKFIGCDFLDQKTSVNLTKTVTGCVDIIFIGCEFRSPDAITAYHLNFVGAARCGAVGCSFTGTVTAIAISFDSTSDGCFVTNSTVGITGTLYGNAGTRTRLHDNPGLNPIGFGSQPTFPLTGVGVRNDGGADAYVNVFASTASVSIAIDGHATSVVIPISGQYSFLVPAGSTITPTYSAGTPAWSWFYR